MTTAHVPEHIELPPPALEEVSDGIFAYIQLDGSWGLNNTGFVAGRDAVVAVDTCFTERRTRWFLESIRSVSERPVRMLINTHHHGDHTHGNYLFLPGATIIGHERCREEILATGTATTRMLQGVDYGEIQVAPPVVTFEDRLNLWVDELQVELTYMGPAHTTNDVVAWIPERKVLFAGDLLFNGGTPFLMMGSVAGSLEALDRLEALGAERIVPGHGSVCGPEVIGDVRDYVQFIESTARKGFEANVAPLELARETDLGRFREWLDGERFVGNLHRAYSELRGEPRGAPLALMQVFGDMLAYNNGQPLRCLA